MSEKVTEQHLISTPTPSSFRKLFSHYYSILEKNVNPKPWICRISEIEPKYYADGEDAYAMKRDLVTFAQQNDTLPADASTFYETKTPEERKRLAALAQENRNMEE